MIETNLSTRPFYNERRVRLSLVALTALVVIAGLFNITRVVQYSRSDTELVSQASGDEAKAAEARRQAARLRETVDPRQIEALSAETREANELIDRRTFSWTELWNAFGRTLPDDVRVVSVRPKVDPKRGVVLGITAVAKAVDDVNRWMESLEATGSFRDLGSAIEERINEEDQVEVSLEAIYTPQATPPGRANKQP